MSADRPTHHSYWHHDLEIPRFASLEANLEADVCVIGAGIAGLTTAYLLAIQGLRVIVLESLALGDGQTGHTTAHITVALDTPYYRLEGIHGHTTTRRVLESHQTALHKIDEIVLTEKIDCDLKSVNGYWCSSMSSGDLENIRLELDALNNLGLYSAQILPKPPLAGFSSGPCLMFPNQRQFHPLKYLTGLAKCITNRGGQIFCHSHVTDMTSGPPAVAMTKDGFSVTAAHLVVASNTPINKTFAIHTKQAPYRSYVIAFRHPRHRIPEGLFWDTAEPYHYIRSHPASDTEDLIIIGGKDHKTGQVDNTLVLYDELHAWTKERFPFLKDVAFRWSGQVIEPVDGLPYLGRSPGDENVYLITGHSGVGMVESTLGAMIVSDEITKQSNAWGELYAPGRMLFNSASEYLKENLNVAVQYADWISPQSRQAVDELKSGEGTVVNAGLSKIAVYRSSSGEVSACSAACTHLKGVVHWNNAEKSWDCPCHGSRFDCYGKVVEGPAVNDLEPVQFDLSPESLALPSLT